MRKVSRVGRVDFGEKTGETKRRGEKSLYVVSKKRKKKDLASFYYIQYKRLGY